jgi:Protein of unknown function (DUF2744)
MSKLWSAADCSDPGKPDEVFLYELQAIPLIGRSPLTVPLEWAKAFSKHLVERCGVLPYRLLVNLADEDGKIDIADLPQPKMKLARPYRGQQSRFNNAAQWIPVEQDEPDPVVIQDPVSMTAQEADAVAERLRYRGYRVNEPVPKSPGGEVTTLPLAPRWNPGDHSVSEVIAYLRNLDDEVEKGRVLAAERTGKARNGILKKFPESFAGPSEVL